MKTSTLSGESRSRLYCNIFGHKYEISKEVTKFVKEYTCNCCKKQLTTSGNGELTELTPKYKEINRILEHIYNKRVHRLQLRMHQLQGRNFDSIASQH